MNGWQGGLTAAETFGPGPLEPDTIAAWRQRNSDKIAGLPAPPDLWEGYPTAPPLHYRTLADIDDSPPGELLIGMFEHGPNLAYGGPGIGKGMSAAAWIVEFQALGLEVAIYDAERRPQEWARRVQGLSGDRTRVVYIAPEDLGPRLASQPLWESAPSIGEIIRVAGVDLLIVDSILPAVGVGEERLRSAAEVPYLYVQALDALGIPSISLGHPPKGQPEGEPFGSMAWTAAMRMTWLGARAEGEAHRVRWRPRKRNERGHIAGVLLSFEYDEDGRPCSSIREDDEEDTRGRLMLMLKNGARSVADMADELLEDEEFPTADKLDRVKERIGRTLRRMARDGSVLRDGPATGRNVRWRLQWER